MMTFVGCTIYPKTYTYSPTVTVNEDNDSSTPLILPNPFAKTPRAKTEYNINSSQRINNYQEYPTYNHEETYVFVGPEYLQAH